jgi:hypothetical protein
VIVPTHVYQQPVARRAHPEAQVASSQSSQRRVFARQYGPFNIAQALSRVFITTSRVYHLLLIQFIVSYLVRIN